MQKRNISKIDVLVKEYNAFYKSADKITPGKISAAISYSCGEIHKSSDGYYTVGHVSNYNGLNGNSVVTLRKLQRDVCAFPNPFIYRINEKVLMLEVKPKYADRVKHLLHKAFTKRYIYDIILKGNQLIIFLLTEEEREDCNKGSGEKACRTDKFNQIELENEESRDPRFKEKAANQELTCDQIFQMLKMIVETNSSPRKLCF